MGARHELRRPWPEARDKERASGRGGGRGGAWWHGQEEKRKRVRQAESDLLKRMTRDSISHLMSHLR